MVADRISLKYIFDTLSTLESIHGLTTGIRIKRKNSFGTTKSVPKFENLTELKEFMDTLHPYKQPASCNCHTKNEGIYTLTSFSFIKDEKFIHIHNVGTGFQSSRANIINKSSIDLLNGINSLVNELKLYFDSYICFPYMEFGYTQCDYIEMVTNEQYDKLIELYKKNK